MWRVGLASVLLLACGGSNEALDASPRDVGPDVQLPGPNHVTLLASGATFVAYRDGNGPWRTPRPISSDSYELDVTDDYQVVTACADATGFDAALNGRTWADGDGLYTWCSKGGASALLAPPTVSVTGQMVQAGRVWMSGSDASSVPSWNFALEVAPGPHDLVAVSADRMLIRRDQSIAGATTEPTVDVEVDGAALVPTPLTLHGLDASETAYPSIGLSTANDFAVIDGTATTAMAPPASLLQVGDRQDLLVFTSSPPYSRILDAPFTGTETNFTLLPLLTGVTFADTNGVLSASWSVLPQGTDIVLDLFQDGVSGQSLQSVWVTQSWLDATGATHLAFDAEPEGYDPSWNIDPSRPDDRALSVYDFSGAAWLGTTISESVAGATFAAPRRSAWLPPPCRRAPSACPATMRSRAWPAVRASSLRP